MFVGHYGVSFAAKSVERTIPLWGIWTIAFALIMLGAHTVTFFGAPPASPAAAAITALVAYAVFAGGASLLEKA